MEIVGLFKRPAVDEWFGLSLCSTNKRRWRSVQVTKAISVPIISLWKTKLQSISFFHRNLESKRTKLHKCYQQMSHSHTKLIGFSREVRELSFSTRKRCKTSEGDPKNCKLKLIIEVSRGANYQYGPRSRNSLCRSWVVLIGFKWFKMVFLFLGGLGGLKWVSVV